MPYTQIGPRRELPEPIADAIVDSILGVDPWMHHGLASRACRVTLNTGAVHDRVSMSRIDEFDDSWAANFNNPADALSIGDVLAVEPSPHALSAELATKAMHGEEWRMGAYRYAVVLRSGETFLLHDVEAVWLPDSMTTGEVVDAIANPEKSYPSGGEIPRPERCYFSMPQTRNADRVAYEAHFKEARLRHPEIDGRLALSEARQYASAFPLVSRPLAYAVIWDQLTTGTSRYERFMGDDIELLAHFAEREGHCEVPRNHIEMGRRLSVVGLAMNFHQGRLSDADLLRLEQLPGWSEALAAIPEPLFP